MPTIATSIALGDLSSISLSSLCARRAIDVPPARAVATHVRRDSHCSVLVVPDETTAEQVLALASRIREELQAAGWLEA